MSFEHKGINFWYICHTTYTK